MWFYHKKNSFNHKTQLTVEFYMSSVTVHIKEVISGAVSHRIVFMLCHLNLTNYYEDIQLLCLTCYFYS